MHHHGSWSVNVTLVLSVAAVFYSRAWRMTARDIRRLAAFLAGLLALWIALASPLAHLDHEQLTAHMVQHLLIMTVAAPLLLWGVRNMTQFAIKVHPAVCWLAGTGVVMWWHIPAIFDLGMSSAAWHAIEQGTFLVAGLLFWLPVMEPWPGGTSRWSGPLYLFLATLPCDALSAFLTFCGHAVYRSYLTEPGLMRTAVLLDQACAGALMWVWVTFAYLFPAVAITLRILSPRVEASQLKAASQLEAA
jgi:cytochrome c oxidase assembly factor CtaG